MDGNSILRQQVTFLRCETPVLVSVDTVVTIVKLRFDSNNEIQSIWKGEAFYSGIVFLCVVHLNKSTDRYVTYVRE